jgi:glycosyltransferase involved in cell wall biosynthesis
MNSVLNVLFSSEFGGTERLFQDFANRVKSDLVVVSQIDTKSRERQFKNVNQKVLYKVKDQNLILKKINLLTFLKRTLRNYKQIIFWSGQNNLLLVCISLLCNRGSRVIVHFGNPVFQSSIFEKIFVRVVFFLMRDRLYFVAPSKWVQESLSKNFESKYSNFLVLPNSVSRFETLPPENKDLTLVFVGRMTRDKHPDLILRAMSKMNGHRKVSAKFFGFGDLFQDCVELAKVLKLDEKVKFYRASESPYNFISSSDIFIFGSNENEGFGISLFEAVGAGLIALSSRVPSSLELFGIEALMFENDESSLINCIEFVDQNRDQALKLLDPLKSIILKQSDPICFAQSYSKLLRLEL